MRSNQNPSGSATRSVGDRNAGAAKLSMPQMPVEWLGSGSWRLPSGKALAEFALQAGFLAPLLFRADRVGKGSPDGSCAAPGLAEIMSGSSEINANVARVSDKQSGNGESR